MYCVFPKQAEKSQLELLLPEEVFIFSSDYALQSNPVTNPWEMSPISSRVLGWQGV